MSFADLLAVGDVYVRGLLGCSVTYTPGVGVPVAVNGIFDAAFIKVDAGNPGIASTSPAVFLSPAELPSNPESDLAATVTVNSVTYYIHEVHPDGVGGGVVLLLHKVA